MKKIENRAVVCFLLAMVLAAGMALFLFRYVTQGGSWASSAFNRHLYNNQGQLIAGTVTDRDGDVLSSSEGGKRTYHDSEAVRRATLHAVGDGEHRHRGAERLCQPADGLEPPERGLWRGPWEHACPDHRRPVQL